MFIWMVTWLSTQYINVSLDGICQQSNLIESILGIPVPPIYVYQAEEGKWDLIDGQQRL